MTRRLAVSSAQAPGDAADDATLARAAGAGDRRAFADLYRRHLDSVFARLTRLVGPSPERDDLVQQIFLDLHRALPRFRGEAALTTFLYRITLNVACEHLERRQRGRARNEPLDDRQLEGLIAPGASPEQRVRQREELRWLFECLAGLSPKRRAAFVLVAVEGLPLEDAAALLNANVPAVKQRVLEARRELAKELGRDAREDSR